MSAALEALAVRCEIATGPDRELESLIADAVWPGERLFTNRDGSTIAQPHLSSVDAALSLMPEDFTYAIDASEPELGILVTVFPPRIGYMDNAQGKARTVARAICAAALRARVRTPVADGEGR